MSNQIRLMLKRVGLYDQTTHEDRLELDREIEKVTGENCDKAIERRMIDEDAFRQMVLFILSKKKKLDAKTEYVMVV